MSDYLDKIEFLKHQVFSEKRLRKDHYEKNLREYNLLQKKVANTLKELDRDFGPNKKKDIEIDKDRLQELAEMLKDAKNLEDYGSKG